MTFNTLLNKIGYLKTKTQSQDGAGQMIDTYSAGVTPVEISYRFNPDRTAGNSQNIGNVSTLSGRFYFLASVSVDVGMVFEDEDEVDWEILNAVKDSSDHHWEVTAMRIIYD